MNSTGISEPTDSAPWKIFHCHWGLEPCKSEIYQHVDFVTCGTNTLEFVYTNIHGAYKAAHHTYLSCSDNISVRLISTSRPLLKNAKLVVKQLRIWSEGAIPKLQDCFEYIDYTD